MLFKRSDLDGIAEGKVTLAFRRWRRPTVRAGGTLTTTVGVLAIESVEQVEIAAITDRDARRAGRAGRADVVAELDGRTEGTPYRIAFRLDGPDPRIALRERTDLSDDEVADLRDRLRRLDRSGERGPWTDALLDLIERRPATRAADLAAEMGWAKERLKLDVRKLKNLGLTESLGTGYRLSPRGRALRETGHPQPD